MLKQANVYRDTYTNVSVRTGINRQTYYDNQWNLNNRLSSLGLKDNVRSSEVQTMWNSLANTGMNESQMFATAIDNVVTNKIVPYLDTTSQEFNLLNSRLNNDFVKDIRGINKANLEIAGNNYVTESLLNTIIDKVQPMSDEALQNLALGSTEITSFVNTLIAKGYDRDTAVSYATKYFQAQEYGDQMLSSGSTADKLFMADIMTNPNLNLYDLDDATNIMALYGNRALEFAGNLGGYSSSTNGVVTNMVAHNLGYTYGDFSNAYKLLGEGLTFTDIANNTSLTPSQISTYSNQATSTFASGQNQTIEELQSVTLENFMNELAVMYETLGLTGPIIVSAIEGLGNILITWLGANLIGKFFGGSGSGLLGKVGSSIKTGVGKVGTVAKTGLSAVGNGSMLAGVGNLASVAGGAYLGYQGFSNMASDISNGEFNLGTGLSTTQGIAGTTAAVAGGTAIGASLLGASGVAAAAGPIGWAALAVAGVAAAGKAIYDEVMENKKINESQLEEMNKQVDEEISQRKEKQREQISAYTELRDEIISTNDVETAKRELLEAGMLTQEEYNDAQINSKDKLMDLTDEYINSAQKLNEASNAIYSEIHKEQNEDMDPYIQKTKEFMNSIVKGAGQTKMYKQDDKGRSTTESTIRALYDYYSTADSLSEDEQKIFNKMSEYMNSAYSDLSWEEIDAIVNVMDNEKKAMGSSINKALGNTVILSRFTSGYGNSWTGDRVTEQLGLEKYNPMDTEKAQTALDNIAAALINDTNTEIASETIKGYINDYKNATGHTDLNSLTGKTKEYITKAMEKYNIESYRQGINNVPADQLAMLHQGEAVLTASTANELRNMTDVYRETTSQTFNLDAIIQNQTSALIIKMDEIIRAITTGVSGTQSLTRNTADAKVWDSMIHMESTKAF